MIFEDFIKNKKVILAQPDLQKSKSLKSMAFSHFDVIIKMGLSEENSSIIFSQVYESLRQILEAIALKEGYKVFSHEAYTYYLKEKGEITIANKFDRYRKLRNGINYYGKPVEMQVTQIALKEIEEMMNILSQKYL